MSSSASFAAVEFFIENSIAAFKLNYAFTEHKDLDFDDIKNEFYDHVLLGDVASSPSSMAASPLR